MKRTVFILTASLCGLLLAGCGAGAEVSGNGESIGAAEGSGSGKAAGSAENTVSERSVESAESAGSRKADESAEGVKSGKADVSTEGAGSGTADESTEGSGRGKAAGSMEDAGNGKADVSTEGARNGIVAGSTEDRENAGDMENSVSEKAAEGAAVAGDSQSGEAGGLEEGSGAAAGSLPSVWTLDVEMTEAENGTSLQYLYGTGIHEGYELLLGENGDFSAYIGITFYTKGTYEVEDNVISVEGLDYFNEPASMEIDILTDSDGNTRLRMMDGEFVIWWKPGKAKAAG